jgi:hypothetical protein
VCDLAEVVGVTETSGVARPQVAVDGGDRAQPAIQLASRGTDREQRTFGLYRLEILAALANAMLLFGVVVYVLVEAVRRFGERPSAPYPDAGGRGAGPGGEPGRVRIAAREGFKESLSCTR